MIPKASGGSRPRDQRPITVLDVLYRIWSKGLVREWSPAIQRGLLPQGEEGVPYRSSIPRRRRPLHLGDVGVEL